MIVLKAIAAIISCCLIACMSHYFYTAAKNPKRLVDILNGEESVGFSKRGISIRRTPTARGWVYFSAIVICGAIILFAGFDMLLSWIPLTWGSQDEDGNFNSIRHLFAGFLALQIFPLLVFVEDSARNAVANDHLHQRVKDLEAKLRESSQAT